MLIYFVPHSVYFMRHHMTPHPSELLEILSTSLSLAIHLALWQSADVQLAFTTDGIDCWGSLGFTS